MSDDWNALAIGGLALAATSLAWQLWYAVRIDRARLRVRATSMQVFGQGIPTIEVVSMTVANVGRRATVLQSVHLTLGRHSLLDRLWPARLRPMRWRGTKSILPFASNDLAQLNAASALPKRLEPGDEATTYIPARHVVSALQKAGLKRVHAFASASTARSRASRSIRIVD